jgi:hypothetical protein
MAYQFYIDTVLVSNPSGEEALDTMVKRDASLGGFLITQEAEFLFTGDAYTILYNKFFSDSFCSQVDLLILEQCSSLVTYEFYHGVVKMSDITVDLEACTIKTKAYDNSFYAYINNNRSVEVTLTSTRTKTGEDITPPTPYDITMFKPSTGAALVDLCKAYRLVDVMEFICLWLSDNQVGFRSDYLGDEATEIFVTQGDAIRLLGQAPTDFKLPFGTLREEVHKKMNISFFIELATGTAAPTLRMENRDYFYTQNQVLTFTDVLNIKVAAAKEKLYGTVNVGSETTLSGGAYTFNEGTSYTGYKPETFQIRGQCNADNQLDLMSRYIISSNVIEEVLTNAGSTDYDEEIFFIVCDNIDTVAFTADAVDTLYGAGKIYNQFLNNKNSVDRFYGYLHGDVFDYAGDDTDEFRAGTGSDEAYSTQVNGLPANWTNVPQAGVTVDPYPFPDETTTPNFDGGGNYDNTVYEYTCPSDGTYSFAMGLQTYATGLGMDDYYTSCPGILAGEGIYYCRVTLTIENQTTGDTQVLTKFKQDDDPELFALTAVLSCTTGDVINCRAEFIFRIFPVIDLSDPANPTFFNYTFPQNNIWSNCLQSQGQYRTIIVNQEGSYFEANGTPSSGAEVSSQPADIYRTYRYEFEFPMTGDEFRTLMADPTGIFTFTHRGVTRSGWIEEIKYKNFEQTAQIKIIAANAAISN